MNPHSNLVVVRDSLIAIAALVAVSAAEQVAQAASSQHNQRVIDAVLGSVETAIAAQESRRGPGFTITEISPDVLALRVPYAATPKGQPRDVRVTVHASAQIGGLFLSFGVDYIDPQPHGPFVIEVGGRGGHTAITLLSGSSLERLAKVINVVGEGDGLSARVSGTGVRIESRDPGSAAFVSVRMVDSVSILTPGSGIYHLDPHDTNRTDPDSRIMFDSPLALQRITDRGQDIRATINGHPTLGLGASIVVLDWNLWAFMRLSTGQPIGSVNAQTLGTFIAFRIEPD